MGLSPSRTPPKRRFEQWLPHCCHFQSQEGRSEEDRNTAIPTRMFSWTYLFGTRTTHVQTRHPLLVYMLDGFIRPTAPHGRPPLSIPVPRSSHRKRRWCLAQVPVEARQVFFWGGIGQQAPQSRGGFAHCFARCFCGGSDSGSADDMGLNGASYPRHDTWDCHICPPHYMAVPFGYSFTRRGGV